MTLLLCGGRQAGRRGVSGHLALIPRLTDRLLPVEWLAERQVAAFKVVSCASGAQVMWHTSCSWLSAGGGQEAGCVLLGWIEAAWQHAE